MMTCRWKLCLEDYLSWLSLVIEDQTILKIGHLSLNIARCLDSLSNSNLLLSLPFKSIHLIRRFFGINIHIPILVSTSLVAQQYRICLGCRRQRRHGFKKIPRRRAWQPTPVFLPGESMDRRAWWARVHRISKSRTWLKRLSMHTRAYPQCLSHSRCLACS